MLSMRYVCSPIIPARNRLQNAGNFAPWQRFFRIPLGLAVLSGVFAIIVYASWSRDNDILKRVASHETQNRDTIEAKVIALNAWVYHNKGFAKNRNYFLSRRLGPTPVQVLESGGDCADKSRLLSALLNELGVPSTLAMLYPCEHCEPVHTIVEARMGESFIALDPVFDVYFPDGAGGYLGISQLSESPDALDERIRELRRTRGPRDKIQYYAYDRAHFQFARTVNWQKNFLTRAVSSLLSSFGYEPFLVARPMILEDPKRLVIALFACSALGFLLLGLALLVNRK